MGFLAAAPLVSMGLGAIGSLFGRKKQNDQNKASADAYNKYLTDRNASVQRLIGQLQQNGYNPFGVNSLTSSGTQSSNTSTNSYQKSNPFITDDYKPLESKARALMEGRLGRPSALPPGYASSQIRNINKTFAGADAAARNMAASRGLGGAQTYALATPAATGRAGQIADFQAELPLKERELQNQDLQMAQGLIGDFGKGQEGWSRGNSSTTGSSMSTSQTPPDMMALANLLMPVGPQATNAGGGSAMAGGALGDLSQMLMSLYLNKGRGGTPTIGEGTTFGV